MLMPDGQTYGHRHEWMENRLVVCFGFNDPLRQYFSLSREREKEERKDRQE